MGEGAGAQARAALRPAVSVHSPSVAQCGWVAGSRQGVKDANAEPWGWIRHPLLSPGPGMPGVSPGLQRPLHSPKQRLWSCAEWRTAGADGTVGVPGRAGLGRTGLSGAESDLVPAIAATSPCQQSWASAGQRWRKPGRRSGWRGESAIPAGLTARSSSSGAYL